MTSPSCILRTQQRLAWAKGRWHVVPTSVVSPRLLCRGTLLCMVFVLNMQLLTLSQTRAQDNSADDDRSDGDNSNRSEGVAVAGGGLF